MNVTIFHLWMVGFILLILASCGTYDHNFRSPKDIQTLHPLHVYFDQLMTQLDENLMIDTYRAYVSSVTYGDTHLSTPLSIFLWQELTATLQQNPEYQICMPNHAGEAIQPYLNLSLKEPSIDGIIRGTYVVEKEHVVFSVYRYIMLNGHMEGFGKVEIPLKALPNLPYLPEPKRMFVETLKTSDPPTEDILDVILYPDRGSGSFYTVGDPLSLYLQTNYNAYFNIYLMTPTNKIIQIVPNQSNHENYSISNIPFIIPPDQPFHLAQAGNYAVQAIARTMPLKEYPRNQANTYKNIYPYFQNVEELNWVLLGNGPLMIKDTEVAVSYFTVLEKSEMQLSRN